MANVTLEHPESAMEDGSACLNKRFPTDNALLINFRPSSDAEVFVNKLRLSVQIGAKCSKNVYAMRIYSN